MLYGTLTDVGVPVGIVLGVFWGSALAFAVARIQMSIAAWDHGIGWGLAVRFLPFGGIAFTITHWEEARRSFFSGLIAMVSLVTFLILWLAGIVMLFGAKEQQPTNIGAPPAMQAPTDPGQPSPP